MSETVVQGVLIHPNDWEYGDNDDRRNISPLHRELQHRSVTWMANRLSPCFASVEVATGYVYCDALGFGYPVSRLHDARTVQGKLAHLPTIIRCEAKATRSDYLASFGPRAKGLARCADAGIQTDRFCLTTFGICKWRMLEPANP